MRKYCVQDSFWITKMKNKPAPEVTRAMQLTCLENGYCRKGGRKEQGMREWARENGLEALYDRYLAECDEIAEECAEEGYPSHGANYELRVAQLEKSYPELFGEDM